MLNQIKEALVRGQVPALVSHIKEAKEQGLDARVILEEGLLRGMDTVGEGFASGKLFIPEVMLAARAMQAGVDLLKEELATDLDQAAPEVVVLGTVQGDQHDIGKNLVKIMLAGAGFEVVDLGINVPAAKLVETAKTRGARLIALSALLTTTMAQMETVTKLAHEEGIRVMIGGAPVSQAFCDKIGADGYAADAAGAVNLARALLS